MDNRTTPVSSVIATLANAIGILVLVSGASRIFSDGAEPASRASVGWGIAIIGLALFALNFRIIRSEAQIALLKDELQSLRRRQVQDEVQVLNQKNA